jgi:hypothetical protein
MKTVLVPAAAVLSVVLAPVVSAAPVGKERGKDLSPQEQKLVGSWKGQTPCGGNFVFRADGTYELTKYGPAGDDSAGTWKVRSDDPPHTLVLTCTKSEIEDEIGQTTELKLVTLNDENLVVKGEAADANRYARVKK